LFIIRSRNSVSEIIMKYQLNILQGKTCFVFDHSKTEWLNFMLNFYCKTFGKKTPYELRALISKDNQVSENTKKTLGKKIEEFQVILAVLLRIVPAFGYMAQRSVFLLPFQPNVQKDQRFAEVRDDLTTSRVSYRFQAGRGQTLVMRSISQDAPDFFLDESPSSEDFSFFGGSNNPSSDEINFFPGVENQWIRSEPFEIGGTFSETVDFSNFSVSRIQAGPVYSLPGNPVVLNPNKKSSPDFHPLLQEALTRLNISSFNPRAADYPKEVVTLVYELAEERAKQYPGFMKLSEEDKRRNVEALSLTALFHGYQDSAINQSFRRLNRHTFECFREDEVNPETSNVKEVFAEFNTLISHVDNRYFPFLDEFKTDVKETPVIYYLAAKCVDKTLQHANYIGVVRIEKAHVLRSSDSGVIVIDIPLDFHTLLEQVQDCYYSSLHSNTVLERLLVINSAYYKGFSDGANHFAIGKLEEEVLQKIQENSYLSKLGYLLRNPDLNALSNHINVCQQALDKSNWQKVREAAAGELLDSTYSCGYLYCSGTIHKMLSESPVYTPEERCVLAHSIGINMANKMKNSYSNYLVKHHNLSLTPNVLLSVHGININE